MPLEMRNFIILNDLNDFAISGRIEFKQIIKLMEEDFNELTAMWDALQTEAIERIGHS